MMLSDRKSSGVFQGSLQGFLRSAHSSVVSSVRLRFLSPTFGSSGARLPMGISFVIRNYDDERRQESKNR